ncbi:MAG: hypothetical protein AB8B73_07060 [Ekhidna sp.]
MQDNLKDHIKSSQEDFELYPFDVDKAWEEISDKIIPEKKRNFGWTIGVAASLLLVMGFVFSSYQNQSDSISGEVAEIENFYGNAIDQKIALVRNEISDDRILKDLDAMDEAFAELKNDLKDNVDNQEVIEAMMDNYRMKLQILEEILKELDKEKGEKTL